VQGAGGHTVEASSANFAAVVGNGVAMTIGFLGPCGLNTPHTHPRATEINFSVNGTLQAGLLVENGARFILNELKPGMASVFPQGAIHFEMNTGCEPATFVAAFNNEDPGVLSLAQRFFGLPPSIVSLSLGDIGVQEAAQLNSKIPDNIVLGVSDCQKRCGITPPSQTTKQQQARVSGNALPSGFSAPAPASSSSAQTSTLATISSTPTSTPISKQNLAGNAEIPSNNLGDNNSSPNSSQGGLSPLLIALICVSALLLVGYFVIAAIFIRRRAKRRAQSTNGWKAVDVKLAGTGHGPYSTGASAAYANLGEYGEEKDGLYDPAPSTSSTANFSHSRTPSTAETRYDSHA